MPLRVRRGTEEMILPDEVVLAELYRRRRVRAGDLVWHPLRGRWVAVEAFLFIERGQAPQPLGGEGEPPPRRD